MPPLVTPSALPRAALGTVLVVGVVLLQVGVDLVSGREAARTVARLVFTSLEMPVLMLALSGVFSWSVRRRMSASRGLAASVAIATVIGGVFGLLYGEAAIRIPSLRLHISNGVSLSNSVSLARSALFGVLNAQMSTPKSADRAVRTLRRGEAHALRGAQRADVLRALGARVRVSVRGGERRRARPRGAAAPERGGAR